MNFLNVISFLDQFEIGNLLSLDAPVLGNLSLYNTNINIYLIGFIILTILFIICLLVFILEYSTMFKQRLVHKSYIPHSNSPINYSLVYAYSPKGGQPRDPPLGKSPKGGQPRDPPVGKRA